MDNDEIIRRIVENESRSKSNVHRIDDLERRQNDLDEMTGNIKTMVSEMGHIKDDVKETKNDIKELKAKPAKRWEAVVDKALMMLVGALVTYVLTSVGL